MVCSEKQSVWTELWQSQLRLEQETLDMCVCVSRSVVSNALQPHEL